MYSAGNCAKALRTVMHGVKTRHNCKQCLCRTNVTRGFFSTDMLLTGLHRHAQRLPSAAVY